MFNEEELRKIKELALENHSPIIMDDTLEVIEKILIQEKPKRILEILSREGYFICDENNENFQTDFKSSYDWLALKMDEKNIYHPEGISYPIWAWYKYDGKYELPNIEYEENPKEIFKRVLDWSIEVNKRINELRSKRN